ncbi:MAG: DUF2141 domain-containing protein [Caulobacteraceae bacterium]
MKWLQVGSACLVLTCWPGIGHAEDAPITFIVNDLRFSGGSVRVDVCTQATFLKSECPFSGAAPAVKGSTSVTVDGVPPGVYAAQIYHDWNDNHRVDRQALGIPREGLAFSNDAPLGLHGPSFPRAAFIHGEDPQTFSVKLHHFAKPPHE